MGKSKERKYEVGQIYASEDFQTLREITAIYPNGSGTYKVIKAPLILVRREHSVRNFNEWFEKHIEVSELIKALL